MQIDVLGIPLEGKEISYQEDPEAIELSPELSFQGPIEFKGTLYKTDESVIVIIAKGTIEARPHLECGRCSAGFYLPLRIEFDQIFVPKSQPRPVHHKNADEKRKNRRAERGKPDDVEPDEGEEAELTDEVFYEGSSISLDETIREQVLLALPMRPLCSPECKGICPVCGANLNLSPCSCPREEEKKMTSMQKAFKEIKRKKGEE